MGDGRAWGALADGVAWDGAQRRLARGDERCARGPGAVGGHGEAQRELRSLAGEELERGGRVGKPRVLIRREGRACERLVLVETLCG